MYEDLTIGLRLAQLIEEANLRSVKIRKQNLSRLRELQSIIITGSSFVGKSTLVDILRSDTNLMTSEGIIIPKRVITRPQRENDNLIENQFCSVQEFDELVRRGMITLSWVRNMEGSRKEKYGFLAENKLGLPVYSANNAIITNKEYLYPIDILSRSLLVAVYAPESIREKRLARRSPDLIRDKPEEVRYRLSDKSINIYPHIDILIKNFGSYADISKTEIVQLVKLILRIVQESRT